MNVDVNKKGKSKLGACRPHAPPRTASLCQGGPRLSGQGQGEQSRPGWDSLARRLSRLPGGRGVFWPQAGATRGAGSGDELRSGSEDGDGWRGPGSGAEVSGEDHGHSPSLEACPLSCGTRCPLLELFCPCPARQPLGERRPRELHQTRPKCRQPRPGFSLQHFKAIRAAAGALGSPKRLLKAHCWGCRRICLSP